MIINYNYFNVFTIAILIALFFTSCRETPKQENAETTSNVTVEKTPIDIVTSTAIDKDGKKLVKLYLKIKTSPTIIR